MGRQRRHVIDGGIYHVMNRGAGRRPVFTNDADRIEFGRLLREAHDRFSVETLAYCLMGNHYHLLLRCPDGQLSEAMQHVSSVFTRHVNERAGSDGPIFRSRFRSHHVETDRYLLTATRYIHRNALDVAGVRSVEQYRWSSHRAYLGLRRKPQFLNMDLVLGYFGGDSRRFDRFVQSESDASSAAVGLPDLRSLAWLASESTVVDEGPSAGSIERNVLLLLVDELLDAETKRVAFRELGVPNDAARYNALSRARRRLVASPEIRTALDNARADLGVRRRSA